MNPSEAASLPQVRLSRTQWVRMVIVGILVVLALGRVLGDVVRVAYPLRYFGYSTNGNGVVVTAPGPPKPVPGAKRAANPAPAGDRVRVGDRVRIDRIPLIDRKPGIAGARTFTYDNPDRYLPIERRGEERILHLVAKPEQWPARFTDMLRILLCVVAVALGAMLFLIKPSIATAAFFVFSLSAVEAPATYFDLVTPMPWRPLAQLADDVLRGFVRPALLLFAFCLIDGDTDPRRESVFAWFAGALGVVLGALTAYAQWSLVYAGQPAEQLERIIKGSSVILSVLTAIALVVAFARAPANDRHRISWIVAAFVFAGIARTLSEAYFPGHMPFWVNSLLVSATIVPIVTIWIAVLRHQFFNVDFVVSRAVVYASITVAAFGTIWVVEDIGTYLWYNSSNLTYAVFYAASIAIGLSTGKLKGVLDHVVDRFIFPDRLEQRQALEFIAGYILDAETVEDVYRALLQDAAHALKLSFGGILARQPDGGYLLAQSYAWPEDFDIKLGPNDELTRAVTRTRGALTFSGKDTRMIQRSFPNERLTFVAPLFFDRTVSGIVVYGHNVSGLDLDPDEREHLVRVVAHASIALNTIELNRYRNAAPNGAPEPLPLPAT